MNKAMLTVFTLILLICIICLSGSSFPVKASGTVFIRADGSVEPNTAPISTIDNIAYAFTDNIYAEIVVERDNIVVDGKGYTVQGAGNGTGILLSGRSNVTVKNIEISAFERGIRLDDSSNNTISANNVTNNEYGIVLYHSSSENTVRHNDASNNTYNLGIFTASASGYIQDIDDSNTVDGKPVYYWVNRRDMAVPLDAGYVVLVNCTRIAVKNLNLTNNMQGVALAFTTNSTITNNNIIANFDGIRLDHSSNNNVVSGNNITANTCYGIRSFYDPSANGGQLDGPPSNNIIYENNIESNEEGFRLDYPSNNTIYANNVTNNGYGIGLYHSSSSNTISKNNIIANDHYGIWLYSSSSGNTIYENNIAENSVGISLYSSSGNRFYHNNFIDNARDTIGETFYSNFWDAGYPCGGNHWSPQYNGKDVCTGLYQNETGSDGIGDVPYNRDNYPLMGMYNNYNVTYFTPPIVPHACTVTVISNSTISDFVAPIWIEHPEVIFLQFNVSGAEGSKGFCRVSFPTAMMNGTYHVSVNGTEIPYTVLPCSDANTSYLYFTYTHSTQEVIIIPEFPSTIVLSLFMTLTMLYVISAKKKRLKKI